MVEFRTPPSGFGLPKQFQSPAVMAIGDSLYNGMRSATINERLARNSVPAMLARAIAPGATFLHPLYPEPVLADLEDLLRQLSGDLIGSALRAKDAIRLNAVRWLGDANVLPNHLFFDNLAIAGGLVAHLIDISAADAQQQLAAMKPVVLGNPDPFSWSGVIGGASWNLVDLHVAINTRFLLNPSLAPELAQLRAIDQVQLRKPKRLFIDIGPNHGLFQFTMFGDQAAGRSQLDNFKSEVRRLIPWLQALDVERIYFNLLPKPSAVPNLMPVYSPDAPPPPLDAAGYFPSYESRLAAPDDYFVFDGATMAAIDKFVAEINEANAEALTAALGGKVQVFDFFECLAGYDAKHRRGKTINLPASVSSHPNRTYSNLPLAVDMNPFSATGFFRGGGIAGLDNHHPSTLGYTLMASEILALVNKTEGTTFPAIDIADREDDLLADLPEIWWWLPFALLDIRRAFGHLPGQPAPAPAAPEGLPGNDKRVAGDLLGETLRMAGGGRSSQVAVA